MLATAFRDPGIIPRDLDPNPPYPATSPSDGAPRVPLPRDLRIGENVVRVKYCVTCKTYRPPRAIHCKACDNCVDACDHHCQWVNNCVGRRNYTSFIAFIVIAYYLLNDYLCSQNITLVLVIVTSALHIAILARRQDTSFARALNEAAGSAVVFCLSLGVLGPLGALMGYHFRLMFYNLTTIEQLRIKAERKWSNEPPPPNPFSYGKWYRNVAYMLCKPAGYTWIEAHKVKLEDRREINPGAWELYD
ncbi:hypothetical protein M422DRAFT_48774 [Sphaerobolus stellatus SS14]|uniref:Palmitoyltransferase n=1 Tax=Sphaerobolus stellatus (strain SS14) TaxID=990650 RepID=A0A0C9VT94_SPHS4|nr:hypothetical protein M422DRAFT_69900 [Sphaerobolus stellatus SS14]KIJ41316.1 hypothetical protein M422DRAFT_48774 [Sphaerobolus stellatus SS14]